MSSHSTVLYRCADRCVLATGITDMCCTGVLTGVCWQQESQTCAVPVADRCVLGNRYHRHVLYQCADRCVLGNRYHRHMLYRCADRCVLGERNHRYVWV